MEAAERMPGELLESKVADRDAKEPEQDEVLCQFGETPPVIRLATVDAVCVGVTKKYFGPFHQTKFVFQFRVTEPQQYIGLKLEMFARIDPKWNGKPPVSSKLFKVTAVALGYAPRRIKVWKGLFVGKVFQCRLRMAGTVTAAEYTIVDIIVKKVTG